MAMTLLYLKDCPKRLSQKDSITVSIELEKRCKLSRHRTFLPVPAGALDGTRLEYRPKRPQVNPLLHDVSRNWKARSFPRRHPDARKRRNLFVHFGAFERGAKTIAAR